MQSVCVCAYVKSEFFCIILYLYTTLRVRNHIKYITNACMQIDLDEMKGAVM